MQVKAPLMLDIELILYSDMDETIYNMCPGGYDLNPRHPLLAR